MDPQVQDLCKAAGQSCLPVPALCSVPSVMGEERNGLFGSTVVAPVNSPWMSGFALCRMKTLQSNTL